MENRYKRTPTLSGSKSVSAHEPEEGRMITAEDEQRAEEILTMDPRSEAE
jgi:hypothetical protein